MAHLWGLQVLIQALDSSQYRQTAAAEAVEEIGPDAVEAVPGLIQMLTECEYGVACEAAAEALREITGQDFNRDTARWQQWWEENK